MNTLKLKSTLFLLGAALALGNTSCKKDKDNLPTNPQTPINFNFETTVSSPISIIASTAQSGARFSLYTAHPAEGGKKLLSGSIAANGRFESKLILPISLDSVYMESHTIGLPGDITIPVTLGSINIDLFTRNGQGVQRKSTTSTPDPIIYDGVTYSFMGDFNANGLPAYLEPDMDNITKQFLDAVDDAFPESRPVPEYNPHYIQQSNTTDIRITEQADVWVTVVHEGAGYRNVIAYYTYPTNNPPTTKAQITDVKIIFPNFSLLNSGGELLSGDKVKLGRFNAGTSIGWVLIQHAFQTNRNGTKGRVAIPSTNMFYSNPVFNPETTKKQHMVMLNMPTFNRMLIGFEDQNRENQSSDEDFNDALYYVTANPVTAISTTGVPQAGQKPVDTDGDEVPDYQDEYPNDPTKAFNAYQPFEGGYTSAAFEDLWPFMGDYDFNDLVVKFNLKHVLSPSNELVGLEYQFIVDHIGASYANGFAIELPLNANQIRSVSGTQLTENFISTTANGLEQGHGNKAIIVVFDNAFNFEKDTINVSVQLTEPVRFDNYISAGIDPFLIVNGDRGREVHLPGSTPTALANEKLLGTGDDIHNPESSLTYKSENGYPWAILISHDYSAPKEKVAIWDAYLKFEDWVKSNGLEYSDWYENKPGYRSAGNVNQRP